MKKIYLTTFICLLSAFYSIAIPPIRYKIKETVADPTLPSGKSVYQFELFMNDSSKIPTLIQFQMFIDQDTVQPQIQYESGYGKMVKPGKHRLYFESKLFAPISTDSIEAPEGKKVIIQLYFEPVAVKLPGIEFHYDKPVIYLYPEQTTEINVRLNFPGELKFTYPAYQNGWSVVADPDGTIHQYDKEYNYLFWEGEMNMDNYAFDITDGYLLKKEALVSFFEEKLTHLGFSSREQEDFITYWVPRMNASDSYYVHLLNTSPYDKLVSLDITPKPDHVLRLYMFYFPVNGQLSFPLFPKTLPAFSRKGFVVTEWGGGELPVNFNPAD